MPTQQVPERSSIWLRPYIYSCQISILLRNYSSAIAVAVLLLKVHTSEDFITMGETHLLLLQTQLRITEKQKVSEKHGKKKPEHSGVRRD